MRGEDVSLFRNLEIKKKKMNEEEGENIWDLLDNIETLIGVIYI